MADGTVRIQVVTNANEASRSFNKLDNSLKDTGQTANKTSRSFGGLKTAISSVVAVLAFRELTQFSQSLSQTAQQAEALDLALSASVKGFATFGEAYSNVVEISDRFGVSLQATTAGFTKFSASALRSGLSLEQTSQIFEDITASSVSLGLPAERLTLIFDALSQIAGKGTLSLEELKQQLGDSLPGAVNIAASSMGLATSEFLKLVEQGEILSKDFLPNFARQLRSDLGGSAEEASKTARASFQRLNTAIFELNSGIGEQLNPTFKIFAEGIADFINNQGNDILRTFKFIADGALFLKDVFDLVIVAVQNFGERVSNVFTAIKLAVNRDFAGAAKVMEDGLKKIEARADKALGELKFSFENVLNSKVIDSTKEKIEETSDALQGLNDLAGETNLSDALFASIKAGAKEAQASMKTIEDITEDSVNNLSKGLSVALTTPFEKGESAAQRFGSVALGILQQVAQELVQKQLVGLFSNLITAGVSAGASSGNAGFDAQNASVSASSGVSLGDLSGAFANGGAFQGGTQAFANGGAFTNSIVSSPTFFPMANGSRGLMGEKGAEAIMPLTRTNGRLGVEASGIAPSVNIYNQAGVDIETVSRPDNSQDIFIRRFNSALSSERSSGAFAQATNRQSTSGVEAY